MRAKPSKSEQLEVRRLMESFASIASSGLYEAGDRQGRPRILEGLCHGSAQNACLHSAERQGAHRALYR
jgi:hypothetical protein